MTAYRSTLYRGRVTHVRTRPRTHRLDYRVFSLLLDIDELPQLDSELRFFGHNRAAVLSFHDRDHGPGDGSPLRPWVESELRRIGIEDDFGRITILCYPRMFGYVFNPLSVYFCHDAADRLRAILYEVGNTFGERHVYALAVDAGAGDIVRQECRKTFHVSPFVPMACCYHFRVRQPDEAVAIAIRESDEAGPFLNASFSGRRRSLDDRTLFAALLAYPLMTLKVIVGIHWEALRLWCKGVPIVRYTRHPSASPKSGRTATAVAPER